MPISRLASFIELAPRPANREIGVPRVSAIILIMTRSSSSAPQPSPAFEPPRSIAIEGPIRVGKSTLARILADRLHARRVFDPEDNPFLADFYHEKPGSAFRAQFYFLIERHHRLLDARKG